MLRSLYASISGLRNHQTRMDVIGNNIANVNTVGYKSSRVTFEESMSQLLSGSSRPDGQSGGINPMQVGLGMNIGSIDTRLSQGNLESTGQITDLSIEGKAYFAVSDGQGTYYSRNGAFQFDAAGHMVLPTNGMILQGRMADSQGIFQPGTPIGNIRVPFNDQSPAKATTDVKFARNLDSDSGAKGSILYTQRFLHHAQDTDLLAAVSDSKGVELGMKEGDILTFSTDVGGAPVTSTMQVTSTSTMADLAANLQTFLRGASVGAGIGTMVEVVTLADDPTLRGALNIHENNTASIENLQITSSRPISSPKITKAFSVPSTIPQFSGTLSVTTDTLRAPAKVGATAATSDPLEILFDSTGKTLGLEDGDEISFRGTIGGTPANNVTNLVYATGASATTLRDLLDKIKDNFKLPGTDGTPLENSSVSMNQAGSDDNIPDGSIVIRGMPESSFALGSVVINAGNSNSTSPSPNNFNSNMNATQLRAATDTAVTETSITVFDEQGAEHTATMRLTPTSQPSEWLWDMSLGGQETITAGQKGKLSFGQDGSVGSFTYDDASSNLEFDPGNGSRNVRINLDVGGAKDFTGLTQFRSPTTASAVAQDGYTMGRLRNISIGENGIITGAFTNGTSKDLAQILVADFTNPGGLQKVKDSVYTTSSNSGDAILGIPGSQSSSNIKPGALELSNVELAQEFTDMITTQRGYQANARVITVSDSLLEELVNLKR
jgi:flagellar hook protein FlgE